MEERIEWSILEHESAPKNADWYWTLWLLVIVGTVAAAISGNWLFAIVILIAGFIIGTQTKRPPGRVSCAITAKGVRVNKEFFPFANIVSFSIDEESHKPQVFFKLMSKMFSEFSVPLEDSVSPDAVRELLSRYVPEVERTRKLSDSVSEYLGL